MVSNRTEKPSIDHNCRISVLDTFDTQVNISFIKLKGKPEPEKQSSPHAICDWPYGFREMLIYCINKQIHVKSKQYNILCYSLSCLNIYITTVIFITM